MLPTIIYEDKNMFAVEKPAGMIVNRADTAKGIITLQDWVESNYPPKRTKDKLNNYIVDGYNKYEEFINRSGIVHRLDKETSGVVLIAKDVETFINLQKQFKNGDVKKTYITLVHGKVIPEKGEIDAPIGRLPWNRTRFGILPTGRDAKTLFEVKNYKIYKNEVLSYATVYPQTGRTHQIRVHFQHIKHPVFGDELYAGRKLGRDDRAILPRHFLHASKISLLNPVTNNPLEIESLLPEDLSSFLDSLENEPLLK